MFQCLPDDLAGPITRALASLGPYAAVRYVDETDSTNDLALSLAAEGAPEGTSVLADCQRRGRGRRGREWFSPPGSGVYLSVVVRPATAASGPPLVTLAAGVALAEAVSEVTSLPIELKWPNDLVIGSPWRKLGGVLTEATTMGGQLDAIVVGIGLNVRSASYPRELAGRATSLETELGRPVARGALLVAVLSRLKQTMALFADRPSETVPARWRRYGGRTLDGASVRWDDGGGGGHGRARDIDPDGALVVERAGRRERIVAGEVTWDDHAREG